MGESLNGNGLKTWEEKTDNDSLNLYGTFFKIQSFLFYLIFCETDINI